MAGRFLKWSSLAATFAVLTACGGEVTTAGNCGGSPCGGNVVGKWRIVQSCIVSSPQSASGDLPPECAGAIQSSGVTSSGTYEFRADGTMAIDIVASGGVTETLTDACMAAIGAPGTPTDACADLNTQFGQMVHPGSLAPGEIGFQSASCSYNPGRCTCRATLSGQSLQAESVYTASGNQLLNASNEPIGYCVQDDTLKLFLVPNVNSTGSGTIVLDRVN